VFFFQTLAKIAAVRHKIRTVIVWIKKSLDFMSAKKRFFPKIKIFKTVQFHTRERGMNRRDKRRENNARKQISPKL